MMNSRDRACKPAAASGLCLVPVSLLVLALLAASLMLLVLNRQEARWFLPLLLGGDALLIYFVWVAPKRLGCQVGKDGLRIRTFAGKREIRRSEINTAKEVNYRLYRRIMASEMYGCSVGTFKSNLGAVQALVSAWRGGGLLLELKNGEILINPRDPERCLEPLKLELEEET